MVNKAITFAVKAHDGQLRKGTQLPYIVHPMEVFAIVSRMTDDREILTAAVLHDTIEDCDQVNADMIRQEFGERVACLVQSESEDKSRSWKERKQTTIDRLREETDMGVLMIALGDKLSNVRSLAKDYLLQGENLWNRFRMKDKSAQGWYYKELCQSLKRMEVFAEYHEFCRLVSQVFD